MTAICTAAAVSPTSQVPAVTNAVVTIIEDSAFFVADRSIGMTPTAIAAAVASAIANVANSSTTAAGATNWQKSIEQRYTWGAATSGGYLASHLSRETWPLARALVDRAGATYLVLDREAMAVVSATSAHAVASAIDSAVTSVTLAVAVAADRPGGCMRATAEAYAEHASRMARVFVDAVDDLTVKSC